MTDIAGLTEDAYETAVAAAVDLVRAKHPDLDLRKGTAVRSLVIEPAALLDASAADTVNRLRTAMSLKAMAREATVPREDADAVLSNFGMELGGGAKATGRVRVNLTGVDPVTIRAGIVFQTEAGVKFAVTKTTRADVDPASDEEAIISANDGTYYFTVPVEAEEVGAGGNIQQGHALTTSVLVTNFASAEAFSDFSGGEDGESVASAMARIPSALAYRGMTNELSVRAMLSAAFSDKSAIKAVSCVGHRDRAQLRDKHNPLGVSVGGRVDVYVRLFDAPGVVSCTATLQRTESGRGRLTLPDYPGFYAVKYVGPSAEPSRQGSLQYELRRTSVAGATEAHDFDVSADGCETAWSAYQSGYVDVTWHDDSVAVMPVAPPPQEAQALAGRSYKVDLYWTPGIAELQKIADGASTRNVAADYVVRSPAICLVSMTAAVRMKGGSAATESELADKVAAYVNGRSFVERLTRSELANVLLQSGAESVDLSTGGMYLGGRVCGADGAWYYLSGDALDLNSIAEDRAMITSGTTVFAAEPGSIQITISR